MPGKKAGPPKQVASPSVMEDAKDMMLLDRFMDIPTFAEHNPTVYDRAQIIQAVMGYVLTGSSEKASQVSGVKSATIRRWKSDSPWWDDTVTVAKQVLSERFEDKFTALLNETLSQLSARLEKGDVVVRNNETINVPVRASELARIMSTLFDRRQLLRGDVTSRSETRSDKSRLDMLKKITEEVITNSGTK